MDHTTSYLLGEILFRWGKNTPKAMQHVPTVLNIICIMGSPELTWIL